MVVVVGSVFKGLSFVLTSLFPKEGLARYAIIGGDGNMCFKYWSFFLLISSDY